MAVLEQTRTRQLHPVRALLVAVAGVLWLLGWLVGKICAAAVWMWVAVKVGWMDARATSRRR